MTEAQCLERQSLRLRLRDDDPRARVGTPAHTGRKYVAPTAGAAPDRPSVLHGGAAGSTFQQFVTQPPTARPCLGRAWTRPAGGPPPHLPTPAPGPPPAAAIHPRRRRPRPPAPPATGAPARHAG